MPDIWRAMTLAEAVLSAESEEVDAVCGLDEDNG
jgi:hypothetical protein